MSDNRWKRIGKKLKLYFLTKFNNVLYQNPYLTDCVIGLCKDVDAGRYSCCLAASDASVMQQVCGLHALLVTMIPEMLSRTKAHILSSKNIHWTRNQTFPGTGCTFWCKSKVVKFALKFKKIKTVYIKISIMINT